MGTKGYGEGAGGAKGTYDHHTDIGGGGVLPESTLAHINPFTTGLALLCLKSPQFTWTFHQFLILNVGAVWVGCSEENL